VITDREADPVERHDAAEAQDQISYLQHALAPFDLDVTYPPGCVTLLVVA
jgi:hypothetical protein